RRWILIVPLQKLRPRIRSGRAEVRSRTHCRICRQRLTISIAQRYVRCQEAPGGLAAAALTGKLPTAPYAMDAVRTIVDNLIWSILNMLGTRACQPAEFPI